MKYHVILEKKKMKFSIYIYMNSSTKYKLEKQNSDESIGYFLMYKRKLRIYVHIFLYLHRNIRGIHKNFWHLEMCLGPENRCRTYCIDEFCLFVF